MHDHDEMRSKRPGPVLASDSSLDIEDRQVAMWRGMSPQEKAATVAGVCRAVRELALTGIRQRHPSATERECRAHYAVLTLGRAVASGVYPDVKTLTER